MLDIQNTIGMLSKRWGLILNVGNRLTTVPFNTFQRRHRVPWMGQNLAQKDHALCVAVRLRLIQRMALALPTNVGRMSPKATRFPLLAGSSRSA